MESSNKVSTDPDIIKEFLEYGQIQRVEFSPFEWSQDLLLVAFKDRILLIQLDLTVNIRMLSANQLHLYPTIILSAALPSKSYY